jgi:hypothetical protein
MEKPTPVLEINNLEIAFRSGEDMKVMKSQAASFFVEYEGIARLAKPGS